MKFSIIETTETKTIKAQHFMWPLAIVICVLYGAYEFGILHPSRLLNLILLFSVLIVLGSSIYGRWQFHPVNYKVISNLILNSNYLHLGSEKIDLNDVSQIEIKVNDWYGKKVESETGLFWSGPVKSQGIDNYMVLVLGKKIKSLQFQIESESHFDKLGICISQLYGRKIKILEHYGHKKSYGLKQLKYKEIQEFKEKLLG